MVWQRFLLVALVFFASMSDRYRIFELLSIFVFRMTNWKIDCYEKTIH